MTTLRTFILPLGRAFQAALAATCLALAACGGSADAPPPPEPSAPNVPGLQPPVVTQQPADLTVTAGQPASFSVAASGTPPVAYQWQRGGTAIAGATAATYTVTMTVLGDSGANFRAVVSDAGGSVTSRVATLTVTQSAPVLTITQQPASLGVVAGSAALFTVAATCSSGTLTVQWQRGQGSGAFSDVAGANSPGYTLSAALGDSGAMFRAALACSGQSGATSSAATLTVTSPSGATLGALTITGLRAQADISDMSAIDAMPDGSFLIIARGRIKRLSADLSSITTIGGGASFGAVDGPLADARFFVPTGMTHDAAGVVYIADTRNHTVRRIGTDGMVSTVAGLAGSSGSADGSGAAARFSSPRDVFVGPDGDLYVADTGNHRIRRVTVAGVVTTYAGSVQGFVNGAATTAQFSMPSSLVVAANGDVIVSDTSNHRIRRVVRTAGGAGLVETLAGNGGVSFNDGIGAAASLASPDQMTLTGNVVTVRTQPRLVRRVDLATRAVTRLTGRSEIGSDGYIDGGPAVASLGDEGDIATAPGNGIVFIDGSQKLRVIDAAGSVRTIAYATAQEPASTGVLAQLPLNLSSGNNNSNDVAIAGDSSGGLIVAEANAKLVRRIAPAGDVTPVAGLYRSEDGSYSSLDGVGNAAKFSSLGRALATDATGAIWASDGSCLRRIGIDNRVTTPAGHCEASGTTDGPGATARFLNMDGVAVAPGGIVYIAEAFSKTIRRLDGAGNVTTVAGVPGQAGSADGPVASARFQSPGSLAVGADGAVYVVDGGALRRISPDGSSVSTVAAAGSQVRQIAIDAAGTIHYLTAASDLMLLPAGAASATMLVPGGNAGVVLGSAPNARLHLASKLAFTGPKTLVVLCVGQLVVVTLP